MTGEKLIIDPHVDAEKWEMLPLISLAGLWNGNTADVAKALYNAATGSGFFYIKDHGVPAALIEGAYAASRAFHDQPDEWKQQYHIDKSYHHRGYEPMRADGFEKDGKTYYSFHETFDLSFDMAPDDPRNHPGYGMVGPNVWPENFEAFREAVSAYYNAIYALGRDLMAAFEISLALDPGTLLQHVTCPTSQLRLLKYFQNDAPNDETHQGIGSHSDFECFTILHTAGPGLQVMSYDDHWVDAPPIEGAFIVNVGDCLEAWTGGLFKSTQHRVVNLGYERYSLPLFFATDFDVVVEPLPVFSTPETRAKYPPFVAGKHLWGRTIKSQKYLKDKIESGDIVLDFEIPEENPFKRESEEEKALKAQQNVEGNSAAETKTPAPVAESSS